MSDIFELGENELYRCPVENAYVDGRIYKSVSCVVTNRRILFLRPTGIRDEISLTTIDKVKVERGGWLWLSFSVLVWANNTDYVANISIKIGTDEETARKLGSHIKQAAGVG